MLFSSVLQSKNMNLHENWYVFIADISILKYWSSVLNALPSIWTLLINCRGEFHEFEVERKASIWRNLEWGFGEDATGMLCWGFQSVLLPNNQNFYDKISFHWRSLIFEVVVSEMLDLEDMGMRHAAFLFYYRWFYDPHSIYPKMIFHFHYLHPVTPTLVNRL